MQLTTTKERVLEAVEKDPKSKEMLKTLFPDAFCSSMVDRDIKAVGDLFNFEKSFPYSWWNAMPGDDEYEKARLMYENYIKPNLPK